jgi:hypothetical protein
MIPIETTPAIKGRGDEGKYWQGEFMYDIFDTL